MTAEEGRRRLTVLLPGSYDPVTCGHTDIIRRASETFGHVYVVIFNNPEKTYRFSLEDRLRMLSLATEEFPNVIVSYGAGLVIDYAHEHEVHLIVKGYRNAADLAYEEKQAAWNLAHGGVPTELWPAAEDKKNVSSTVVRACLDRGDDTDGLLPPAVADYIRYIKTR